MSNPPVDEVKDAEQFIVDEEISKGFQTSRVMTIVGGHFIHDTYSAFIPPLLPLIRDSLSINNTLAGSLAIVAQLPSILNPFIGYLADRVSVRYFVIFAPAITGTAMSLMGLANSYLALVMLLLAGGVSIAAFHAPAPAMIGRISGNQVGRGMSFFMASGELGRTLGPLAVAGGIELFGVGGIWRLAIVGWIVTAILFVRLRDVAARPNAAKAAMADFWSRASRFFLPLALLMLFRNFMMAGLTTYLPIYMSDEAEVSLWFAAGALTILEAAGVVGALFAGTWSDRFGRKRMLATLLSISPFVMLGFVYAPGWWKAPLLILLGLTAISPSPVLMTLVQDHFPVNRSLANGIYITSNFLVRAVGIFMIGFLFDRIGLVATFTWSAALAFLSLPGIWLLPQAKIKVY